MAPLSRLQALILAFAVNLTSALVILPEAFLPPPLESPLSSSLSSSKTQLPLVIWHGLGDRYDADGLKEVSDLAKEVNPGTYVHIIRLGDTGGADRSATFFGNVTEELEEVCEQLQNDPIVGTAPAVNALGFSQGGQFLRGYIERCNKPPVRSLVTFGSQHNGISEFQNCASATDWVCNSANAFLRSGTWSNFVQSHVVPAQYFRDPADLENYLEHSNFLADINNERKLKNAAYKKNLSSINKFVLYLFADDKTVVPKETGWFAEVNTTSQKVTPIQERPIYKEDWIGLKTLDERGDLVFETVDGGHMQLTEKDLRKAFKTYFGPQPQSAGFEQLVNDTTSRQNDL